MWEIAAAMARGLSLLGAIFILLTLLCGSPRYLSLFSLRYHAQKTAVYDKTTVDNCPFICTDGVRAWL
jgi:hypothetical protein